MRVSDGKGGYATKRLNLTVNPLLVFNGQVVDSQSGAALAGSVVQLNSFITQTDDNGFFLFELTEASEYVLTIARTGYVGLHKILTDEAPNQVYRLVKSSFVTDCDPRTDIDVTNPSGVVLHIPAQTLKDANGNIYTGCVSVALDSIDLCDPESSFVGGDFTADGSVLDAFGLVNVVVVDSAGNPLFLNASDTVRLFVPAAPCIDPGTLPASAEFLGFDATSFRWDSVAPGNGALVVVNGFLGFQAGIVGRVVTGGKAILDGVIQVIKKIPFGFVIIKPDNTLHVPFELAVFDKDRKKPLWHNIVIDQSKGQLVVLPSGKIQLLLLSLREAPGEFFSKGAKVEPANKTVIQVMTPTVPQGLFPVTTVTVGLGRGPDRLVQLAAFDPKEVKALEGAFLSKQFGVGALRKGPKDNDGLIYYKRIDPGNKKDTFLKWQEENGWPKDKLGIGKGDDAYALYFNSNDLGAGRRMGMKRNAANTYVAYYVATYASLKDAEADEQAQRQPGQEGSSLKYIVCMEYSPHPTETPRSPYIKFYAYDKKGLLTSEVPDEDRDHPMFMPYACTICHGGGSFDPKDKRGDVKGQFIGFDTSNFDNVTLGSSTPLRVGDHIGFGVEVAAGLGLMGFGLAFRISASSHLPHLR